MIRLIRSPLSETNVDRLDALTEIVSAKTQVRDQIDCARHLWKSRPRVKSDLRIELTKFAAGRDKCMYCGDNEGTDIDHYKPISRWPLLTFEWLNHLLACSTCNSRHKGPRFPLGSQGEPLLLDPTRDDPFVHLALSLSVGTYAPLSVRGEATIEICKLNRDVLARGRQHAGDVLGHLLRAWKHAGDSGDLDRQESITNLIHDQPFADVTQAMLRYCSLPGAEEVFEGRIDLLPILRESALQSLLQM